ncbi:MAG TPA: SET domain-containing protein-lysine N-methyltransferase [Dehalococcoidia bacterium]|nr:SET domain-containing protein-lysine N-methyltransferase [Dehalococcoidia bacterium]
MSYRIKKLDEDFYNPYDEVVEQKPKKPVHISDKGGLLKPRREIFNINRVVYSKRPNGEFTVMAKTQFAQGEIIEICPIIFVGREAKAIDRIKDFIFEIEKPTDDKPGMFGLVLGYGSIYKHSEEANVEYAYNRANRQMYFKAARIIQAHEELTINYGKDYWQERTSFNTMAPKNETPAEEIEENVGQPQAPSNPTLTGLAGDAGNPAVTGVAFRGAGQS